MLRLCARTWLAVGLLGSAAWVSAQETDNAYLKAHGGSGVSDARWASYRQRPTYPIPYCPPNVRQPYPSHPYAPQQYPPGQFSPPQGTPQVPSTPRQPSTQTPGTPDESPSSTPQTPGQTPDTNQPNDNQAADDNQVDQDLSQSQDLNLFTGAEGAARTSGGSAGIVGDFFIGGGQVQIQQAPLSVFVPGAFVTTTLVSDLGTDTFSDNLGMPTIIYDVTPGSLLSQGGQNPITNWAVTGALGPDTGNNRTVFLEGIEPGSGRFVGSVSIQQPGTIVLVPQPNLLVDIPAAGGTQRVRIADNNDPYPKDRVFFNYNYFHNAVQGPGPIGRQPSLGVNRYVTGLEKTFLSGMASIQFGVPFAGTLNSNQFIDGSGDVTATEFGNVSAILKFALYRNSQFTLVGGVGMNCPTANDARVYENQSNPTPIIDLHNDSFHLTPYLAFLHRPNAGKLYYQAWAQCDFDTNGNRITINPTFPVTPGASGRLQDQTLLYLDGAVGYSLLNRCKPGPLGLTDIIPAIECHYTTSLQDADTFQVGNVLAGNLLNRFDVFNLTLATHFQFFKKGRLTPAYCVPLSSGTNKFFDGEFALQSNWRF